VLKRKSRQRAGAGAGGWPAAGVAARLGAAPRSGILVNPAAATHFVVSGPSSLKSGTAFQQFAEPVDAYGNQATGYSGTDTRTALPANYTFSPGGGGSQTLGTFTLRTKGTQTITITDVNDPSIFAVWTVTVT
jgi:hypothetical protein